MSLLSWGRHPKIKNKVLQFKNQLKLKTILKQSNPIIAHGNGRSYGDSALNDTILHMKPHDYFINFDEEKGLLHVQSGVLLSDILESFVPRGWFLKVTPGTKFITIGGAIAADVHGKNHHTEGCFSTSIKEFTIMLANGDRVTCSKETTPELFKATCGGMGLTGVILNAKIYLKRIHSQYINQTTIKTQNLKETFSAFETYKGMAYSVAWIDCLSKGTHLGKALLMVGDFQDKGLLNYQHKNTLSIPFDCPNIMLDHWNIRAFNWLYYQKKRGIVSTQTVDINSFFYPLDSLQNWNRIYGKAGFIQYQFILPKQSSYEGLEKILGLISDSQKGAFLAVLKLYGPANDNYLSFPMEGYSLALDFKIEKGLFTLLEALDKIIVQYGGRIYLAKDARVSKEVFEQGYPDINAFREYRQAHGMDKIFQSLQSKRVEI